MPTPSERDLRRELDDLRDGPGEDLGNVCVEWRDAAHEERPEGMTWDLPTEEDPGRLAFDAWEAQRECLDAVESGEYDITAFLAGFGSGKSVLGARWLLAQAVEHPGSQFLVMGQSFAEARDATFKKFFAQLPGENTTLRTSGYNGPENSPLIRDYNRTERRLTLYNDTEIVLGSADKYSRFAGAEFGGVWCDEVAHYGNLHDLLEMLTSRLRGVDGPKTQLWTTTPEGYNDLWEIVEQEETANGEALGLDIATIRASVLDNPYLPTEAKDQLRRQFEGTARANQALHGDFAEATGKLLNRESLTFAPEGEALPEVLEEATYEILAGVDLGFVGSSRRAERQDTDYTAVVIALRVKEDDTPILLFNSYRKRGLTLSQTIAWLQDIEEGARVTWKIEDVAGSKHTVQEARRKLRGRVVPVTPEGSKADRLMDMETLFSGERVVLLNEEGHDGPREFSGRWREFVDEWTQFGTDDAHDDLLDATYYALENIQPGRKTRMPTASGDLYDRR